MRTKGVLRHIFNLHDEQARGRSMILANGLAYSIVNAIVGGAFSVAFLAENGIDIVRVGILSVLPYISWFCSLFAPKLLARFSSRRRLLLFNHLFYATTTILATTIMPLFVADAGARTLWFAVFLLAGNVCNALVGVGATAWHLNFLSNDRIRVPYFAYSNLLTTALGTGITIAVSFWADRMPSGQQQLAILSGLRLLAFGLAVIGGLLMYLVPKEYPYAQARDLRLSALVKLPLRALPFRRCALLIACWSFGLALNGSTWPYYVVRTVGSGYLLVNLQTIIIAVCAIAFASFWQSVQRKAPGLRGLLPVVVLYALFQGLMGLTQSERLWPFWIGSLMQGFLTVGAQLIIKNCFYVYLPDNANVDIFDTFWNLTMNISLALGALAGTLCLAWFETFVRVNPSQVLSWIKALWLLVLAFILARTQTRPDMRVAKKK